MYIEQVSCFQMLNNTQLEAHFTPQIDLLKHAQLETHFALQTDLLDWYRGGVSCCDYAAI